MALSDNEKQFLLGLRELSLKHGVTIGGCGCCGSPWLDDRPINAQGAYNYPDEELAWLSPPGPEEPEHTAREWHYAVEDGTLVFPES